ncbi:butyrate kinase [Thermosediminibacter litoriperuensis]|uniref:Probable butyrate kinase n=1 Tax=Thermosediminibacter litoriperuensis TaxID=291989 RepID=A0A5S5AYY8_9FIRM|nr:butyrate kinase [Thermosediminibacter litoriperuensis]TYP58495.1 butyrate kinase [Thermosediminibacter litoriperuensis]
MEKARLIFTVNPGATSTKCALYRVQEYGLVCVASENIEHPAQDLAAFNSITEQLGYREKVVKEFVERNLPENARIVACAGRGGMLTPLPSGVIKINEELVDFSLNRPVYQHASNLGAPLAYSIARLYNVEAFIADPVSVDEFPPIARISGSPDFPRFSFVHALNIRATVRKLAAQLNKRFEDMRCVVAHLGGGFSIAAVDRGKIVDNDNRMESAPFTPERAGGVPPIPLIEACFSGKYTKQQLMKKLYGEGGLYAYLGTKDLREVLARIKNGDDYAKLIYDAMIYQICKEIAAMGSVLCFDMDGIIITGGIACSEEVVRDIKNRVGRLGNIYVFPGSNENEALAESVLRVLQGRESYMTWPVNYDPLTGRIN